MAKSTKSTFKPAKNLNYKSVVTMAEGGNVSELNYSERREYIEENYAPFITDAQMIFSIYDSGIEYDYKGDRNEVVSSIIDSYKELGDYTETTLPQETIYEIQDWDLVRKEIDPETDEVISETSLEELSADNTYNFSYNGLVDLNWRVYHDEEYDRFFYVIMPHLGGDIRGNYGDAIILEGNDKEELFYRFYEGFISGGASIYIKFKDGSEIAFDSEQDSDVFYFRVSESFEPTGMAQKYLEDFEQFETWQGDEFLEETIDIYLARKGVAPKMMAGGSLNDETPMAYIQILGYDEGQWFNLTDYSDGQDVIDSIFDFMNELNNQFGGNREEFEVTDYEGFGDDLYDRYMGANEFEEIIEAYEKYQSSDFPADVISAYKKDSGSGSNSLSDVIDEMDNNYFGKYDNLKDFGYEMVEQGVYEPSDNDVYITDTDKRIMAGEESDALVNEMSFEDLMNIAPDTESEYEDEKSELEDKIVELQEEIKDLTELQNSADDDDEYGTIAEQIEEKEIELEDAENSYVDIDSRFEDKAREEARDSVYDEIYDKLENDLSSWLEEYGYTSELQNLSFLSVDYENIGDYLSSDYLIVEYDGEMYFFNNYAKGGRITASKRKPKYAFYIVESSTKKLVSGYSTKAEANEQRKLLVQQYPSMRFEIYPLANLEAKTDLDVYAKKDYVELSTLDKIKKVSVDAYRYGQEKVGQAQMFLEKNDVKSKIKRGARKVYDKTKQGANWLRGKWLEADFGDGTGRAKFFADGGSTDEKYYRIYGNATKKGFDLYYFNNDNFEDYIGTYATIDLAQEQAEKDGYKSSPMYYRYADGGIVGSEIEFNYYGEPRMGTIYEDFEGNSFAVQSGTSKMLVEKNDILRFIEPKKERSFSFFENGGELYDMSLPMGFYVKINPNYTATIRNLNSFESYLERKDEIFGKEFGEITNVDKSASQEWVAELNRLIEKKKSELETKGTGNYKVGDEITLWRNQADRDGYVLAVDNNEMLVEYEMPNGTSALNIIDLTLPEYDKYNYNKNYKTISYDNARKSKKWSGKIDANRLINNPQGSSRRKLPTKRFANGGEFIDGAKYKVIDKSDKHYGQVGFSHYGIERDNKGVSFVSLEFPNGVNTYSMDEVERVYANGGDVGKSWTIRDNDDLSVASYLNETQLIKWAKQLAKENGENVKINSSQEAIIYIEKRDKNDEQDFEVYENYANGGGLGEYFKKFENDFSSTRRGGVKNYSVDIDLENGEQLRGGDLDFKDGNDALFLYERIKKKGEYQNEKIEDIQLIANFKNGDYESVDIPRYNNGGMAGLGEVSGMLPNALPMSTITPMARGGKLEDWKKGKFINGKKWYLYKYDNKRWVLEIYKKDNLIDSYYIDVEELENQETGIGKKMYISYSNSQGSGILIPEIVQVKVFNVIKMDNPKLYFGENVYDYQIAHNKFSDEFGYANGGGVGNVLLQVGDVVVIYPNYASIYTNSKGEIVDIMPDGKTYEIKIKRNKNGDNEYVKFDKSELKFIGGKGTFYDNGGGVEIAEIPTRERTTITKPTTTPTTTPSKPDKDSPYKPKGIPKPKATRM